MNTTAFPPYQYAPGFWPFSGCTIKSVDMTIHPAFIHTAYPNYPGQYTPGTTPVRTKSDSFTIDAILSRDRADEVPRTPEHNNFEYGLSDNYSQKEISPIIARRHARVHEHSHPYLTMGEKRTGHVTPTATEKRYSHPENVTKRIQEHIPHKDKDESKTTSLKPEWKQGKSKRIRTIFTPDQLERLEAEFEKQQYMVGTERYYLACSLNLTEAQVKVWFQNRRIKWRKQNLEQQQAKLAKYDFFRETEAETDSIGSDEDVNRLK